MKTYAIYQNLLAQVERVFRHCRQGSIQTRRRYKEAVCRFCYFLAEVYHVERVANIAPKHIYAYTEFLKENRRAASTIKTDLAAIRFSTISCQAASIPSCRPTRCSIWSGAHSARLTAHGAMRRSTARSARRGAKAARTTLPQSVWRGTAACASMRSSDWTPRPASGQSKPDN